MNDKAYEKIFNQIFISLCSNPALVTLIQRDNGIINSKPNSYEGFIAPMFCEIAAKLTAIYFAVDTLTIEKMIIDTVHEWKIDYAKMNSLVKDIDKMKENS